MADSKVSAVRVMTESLLAAGATILLAHGAQHWLSLANLAFLFLVPVIVLAGTRGLAGGLFTALLATLGFNFFFVPPSFTLHVADVDNLVTLAVLALTALLVSQVTARLKAQAMRAEALLLSGARLASLTDHLASCTSEAAVLATSARMIEDWTGATVRFIAEEQDGAESPLDAAAARWAMAHSVEAGRGTAVMAGADALYLPLDGGTVPRVAQLWRSSSAAPVSPDLRDLVRQALIRSGNALHRVTVEARQEREAMREAVLASIGHDLRTPLTGIMAGLAALPEDQGGLTAAARADATRLDRLITNILGLARLRADALPNAHDVVDLTDAVDAALGALSARLVAHTVRVRLAPNLPLVRSDARMLHHMLLNLIDNAAKFSKPASTIIIEGIHDTGGVSLHIVDEGRGLPNGQAGIPRRDVADTVPGSGLGLSVVSGFATALGIGFQAENRSEAKNGARMSLSFRPSHLINITENSR